MDTVLLQLLAQSRAIDAERRSGATLIAAIPIEHLAQQGRLDFADDERMKAFTGLRIDIGKIAADRARDAFAQRRLQGGIVRDFNAQRSNGIHY